MPVAHSSHMWNLSSRRTGPGLQQAGSAGHSSLDIWAGELDLSLAKASKGPPGRALAFHIPMGSLACLCLIRSGHREYSRRTRPAKCPCPRRPGSDVFLWVWSQGPCLFPLTRKPGLSFLKLGRPRSFSLPKEEAFPVLRSDMPSADFTARDECTGNVLP